MSFTHLRRQLARSLRDPDAWYAFGLILCAVVVLIVVPAATGRWRSEQPAVSPAPAIPVSDLAPFRVAYAYGEDPAHFLQCFKHNGRVHRRNPAGALHELDSCSYLVVVIPDSLVGEASPSEAPPPDSLPQG